MANSQFTTRLIANAIFWIKRRGLVSPKVKFLVFTGTVGKTTLRDTVAFGLKRKGYGVESNNLGYSNEVGILLTALGIKKFSAKSIHDWFKLFRTNNKKERFACIELGADFYRDIKWFIKRFTPTAVFISGIAEKDWAGKAEHILSDRKKLLESVPKSGHLIYNVDDRPTVRLIEISHILAKKATFSLWNENTSAYVKSWSRNIFSFPLREIFHKKEYIEIIYDGNSCRITFNQPLFESQIYAILAASVFIAALTGDRITEKLFSEYRFSSRRLQFSKAKNNAVILEDSYKATPLCTAWFLGAAANIRARKKILVLTEMRPLTFNNEYCYKQLADMVRFATKVYFLGPSGGWRQIVAVNKDVQHITTGEYPSVAAQILRQTNENDIILLKGSFRYQLDRLKKLLS